MSATVKIPSDYTIRLKEIDAIDLGVTGDPNKPIATRLTGDSGQPIATLITGDPNKPLTTQIEGNPSKPLATTVELLNIPRLTLADIKDLLTPRLRIRLPNYEQICLKLFGVEVLSLCLSGEFQTITGPYVPNRFEQCDLDCPEVDKRPFPDHTATHKSG